LTNIRNVTSITNTTNISRINSFRFVNERVATAVVPTTALASGQRIDRQVIRVNLEQLGRAEVIPHPEINPTARALGGGSLTLNRPGIATPATIPVTGQRLPPTPGASQPYQPPVAARHAPAGAIGAGIPLSGMEHSKTRLGVYARNQAGCQSGDTG